MGKSGSWTRRSVGFAAMVATALGASVLHTPAKAASTKHRLIIGVDSTASEYWAEYIQGVKDIARSVHRPLTILTSGYQGSKLLAQLDAMYARGCNGCALAIDPSSNAFVKAAVGQAAKAGVYVVTIWNRPTGVYPWNTYPKYWVAHTSFDGVRDGYLQGMALCHALHGHGDIAAIEGVPSTTPAYQRIDGLHKALNACPGMKLLTTQVGDWQETKAQTVARALIARYGSKLKGVFASNDAMASGVVAALKARGLNKKVFVTGSDGSSTGLRMVKDGNMLATVWNDPVLQGAVSMAIAYGAAVGDIDPQKLTHAQRNFYLKEAVVTKANVNKYLHIQKHEPNYTYAEMKKDFWAHSQGEIPAGSSKK